MFMQPKVTLSNYVTLTENTKFILPETLHSSYIMKELEAQRCALREGKGECESLEFILGIPDEVKRDIERERALSDSPEQYVLVVGKNSFVYAVEPIGFLRALSTIMQMNECDGLLVGTTYDYPACEERGYRVYMPGRQTLSEFKDMVDMLVYYKVRSIVLEVGGAMEYERHPKINEEWVKFCKEISKHAGRAEEIQTSQRWPKNSIHYENGDGSYLTKAECRELAAYCRERGLEIIPECPTLSHADYICFAYPEIAERQNDPWPDCYCPNHPDTYKIVFDILDEVIEVFEPKRINIGHDEYYSVSICERCKDKDPADIYAEDVKTISEYLAARGIGTLMWGEKLVRARLDYRGGRKVGGWNDPGEYKGVTYQVPPMFTCADKMPKGVTYLHWYYSFGEHTDDEFHCRDYPVLFGNFCVDGCKSFRTRIGRGIKGGFMSNWGSCHPEYMQRNHQYYHVISSAYALWSEDYDSDDMPKLRSLTFKEMFRHHNRKIKNPLKVLHNAVHQTAHGYFWCGRFIEDKEFLLGHYEVTYEGGEIARLPVKFGTNISSHYSNTEAGLREVAYSALPTPYHDGYLYEHWYENPHPDKKIKAIKYVPMPEKESIGVEYNFFELDLK